MGQTDTSIDLINSPAKQLAVPFLVCIGWGLGSAGMAAMNLSRSLILRFFTDHLAIAAASAGLLFAFAKIFDAMTDPAMGWLSDRTNSRFGRRSPYLFVGALLSGLAYFLLFNVPDFGSTTRLLLYVECVLIFFTIAYTLFSVPYLSMPVDIAPNYHQRSFLLSFRAMGVAVGGLTAGVLGPIIIARTGGTRASHEFMSWFVAAGVTAFMLTAFWFTRQVRTSKPSATTKFTWREKISTVTGNSNFLILVASKFCFFTGIATLNASGAFFTRHVLQAPDTLIAVFFLCFFVAVVVAQPLWLSLGKRFSKHRLFTAFAIFIATINLTWFLATPDETRLLFVLRSLCLGAGFGGIMVMGQSMLPDVIEFDKNKTGLKREGLYAGIFSVAEKSSTALGVALVGLTLGAMHYVENANGEFLQQSASAIRGIYICFALLPALFILFGAWLISYYELTEAKLMASRPVLVN